MLLYGPRSSRRQRFSQRWWNACAKSFYLFSRGVATDIFGIYSRASGEPILLPYGQYRVVQGSKTTAAGLPP
jgi:hypothetical protein